MVVFNAEVSTKSSAKYPSAPNTATPLAALASAVAPVPPLPTGKVPVTFAAKSIVSSAMAEFTICSNAGSLSAPLVTKGRLAVLGAKTRQAVPLRNIILP